MRMRKIELKKVRVDLNFAIMVFCPGTLIDEEDQSDRISTYPWKKDSKIGVLLLKMQKFESDSSYFDDHV